MAADTKGAAGRPEPPLVRSARWMQDRWPQLVTLLGTIGMSFTGVALRLTNEPAWGWLFLVAAGASVTGNAGSWNQQQRMSALQRRNDELAARVSSLEEAADGYAASYFDLISVELSLLYEILGFTDEERISVYKHDGRAFVILGRYTKHPEYRQRGRPFYADDEGCIGQAWRHDEAFVDDLPDPKEAPTAYFERLAHEYGISRRTAAGMRMKSRSYAAFALDDPAGFQRIGIIVLESTSPGAFDPGRLRRVIREGEGRRIAEFLVRMKPLEPSPAYARAQGF
jgi:hypothetical protein